MDRDAEISDEEMVEALHDIRDRADVLELTQVECDALDRAARLLLPQPILDKE